jgi:hypothetical protein
LQKEKAAEDVIQIRETFTTMVLPDTQFYCDTRLKLAAKWGNEDLRRYFFKQTEWGRDNQERLNIAFLVHEGDIVKGGENYRSGHISLGESDPLACKAKKSGRTYRPLRSRRCSE